MNYYSLNHQAPVVDFGTATLLGQAPDKGLYFPEHIPQVEAAFVRNMHTYSKAAIGLQVMAPYVGNTIPKHILATIIEETLEQEFPIIPLNNTTHVVELFNGPTLAFKDVGARFMSRCLGYITQHKKENITVLVATSGDTGGAVASGFYNVPGVHVVILYPSGRVSKVQELQLTTLGGNITALEVAGSFDNCQAMVKQAFADEQLTASMTLTSANSINVARWLPQQMYYWLTAAALQGTKPATYVVPSGNFGNMAAGVLAHAMGMPSGGFVAACNANDVVPKHIRTGVYDTVPSVATISNAMDVANPSNYGRVQQLYALLNGAATLHAYTTSDALTRLTVQDAYASNKYILDPHTAVGVQAWQQHVAATGSTHLGMVMGTAHPIKFAEVIAPVLGITIPEPASITKLHKLTKHSTKIDATYEQLKAELIRLR